MPQGVELREGRVGWKARKAMADGYVFLLGVVHYGGRGMNIVTAVIAHETNTFSPS